MIQNLRDKIQGWFAGVMVALIAVAFVFWGIEYYLSSSGGSGETVATVNGKKISEQALTALTQQMIRKEEALPNAAPLTDALRKQIRSYTLQNMIANLALWQAATKAGFSVSLDQVKALVQSSPEFQDNGQFSLSKLNQLLMANGMTMQQFLTRIQMNLMTAQLTNGIQGSAFALPAEVDNAYALINEKRDFTYFILPIAPFKKQVVLSEKSMQQFYEQNKQLFKTPERVKVRYLRLSPTEMAKTMAVSEAELKQFYQANQANFRTPARYQISRITVTLPADASPEAQKVAQQKMQALTDAIGQSGFKAVFQRKTTGEARDRIWVAEDKAPSALMQVLRNLKPNDISKVYRSTKGLSVVQLQQVKAGSLQPFSAVESKIKAVLTQQKVAKKLNEMSQTLSDLVYTNPTTLDNAAKALNLKVQTTDFMTRQGESKGVFSNPAVLKAVFSSDVLEQGNNSTPIELKNGDLVVVRVAKREASEIQPFSQVKDYIKKQQTDNQANRLAGVKAYDIQTALNQGKSIQAVAQQYGLKPMKNAKIMRTNKDVAAPIMNAVFGPDSVKGAQSIVLKNGDFAIVKLENIARPSIQDLPEKTRQRITQSLDVLYAQLEYRLYAKGVMDRAKVKFTKQQGT